MSSKKNFIECELRGPITWNDFSTLRDSIEKKWGPFKRIIELAMFAKGKNDFRIKINKHGIHLIFKYRAKSGEAKFEREVDIKPESLLSLIDILHNIGETKWVLSYADKFEVKNRNRSISFKFGSQIGDFFEIEELVSSKKDIPAAIKWIKKTASSLGLQLWSQDVFDKISKKSWEGVNPEPLVENKKPHPLIIKALNLAGLFDEFDKSSDTIAERLKNKDNDFTHIEDLFFRKTKNNLLSYDSLPTGKTFSDKVSIIIPSFNSAKTIYHTLKSIYKQKLTRKEWGLIDIIVIDDGSNDNTSKVVSDFIDILPIKYVRQNNLGRSQSRNLGAHLAHGDILIFIDSDVVLENNFIKEHVIRHSCLNNIALISFKENIKSSNSRILEKDIKPNISKDFRFKKKVKPEWLRMHRHVQRVEVRTVELLKETDNFKNFGKDRVLGVWDLPSMFVTNAVSIKKKDFESIGGFCLQFNGWGMEDTFFGASLIALGCYIIPVFSTGVFHIEHKPRSGSHKKLIKDFNRNVLVYLDLIHQPIKSVFKKGNSY